jgi:hypothetical protein
MAAAIDPQITVTAAEATRRPVRREKREEKIRIVEYSGFPRVAPQQRLRLGFTRDVSRSGICLGVDRGEAVGSLLRLSLRDIEGRGSDACIGRVVWTSRERDGRHWLGIELLTPVAATDADRDPGRRAGGVSRIR